MFVQIINAKAADPSGARRQLEQWRAELAPGATGWLGATSGVSPNGELVIAARFESEEAARKNSERPEQGQWYEGLAACLEGEPTFTEASDIEERFGGGSDDAGFVQVIQGTVSDPARFREIWDQLAPQAQAARPEILGGYGAWSGNRITELIYFASEEAARQGEAQERPAEMQQLFEEWQSLLSDVSYIDLPDPLLQSP